MKTRSVFRAWTRSPAGAGRGVDREDGADAAAFRALILPHLEGAYNLACYLTRDPALSEDVVQDAFVRAFRGFSQFRGDSPRAWLFTIVRNCCRSAQSARTGRLGLVTTESGLDERSAAALRDHPDPAPTPEDVAIRRAEIERVRLAIESIPEPFREAVVLRDIEDLSYGEVAEVTGVPLGTVMSRLSRGRTMLAAALLPTKADAAADAARGSK